MVLLLGWYSHELVKKYGFKFAAFLAVVLLLNAGMSLRGDLIKFHPTYDEEVAKFLLENKEPYYLTSETRAIYPSYLMFNLAKTGEFIKSYRYCALEKSTDVNQSLYDYSVKWVVYDPERSTITIDPKMANITTVLKEKGLLEFERKIGEIEIYSYRFYDGHEPPRCNYICLLRDTVCVN